MLQAGAPPEAITHFITNMTRMEKLLAFLSFVVMLLALLSDVLGRELFGQGVFGSVKVAVYALILCAMAGFGIATATGTHLRPQFMDGLLTGPLRQPGIRLGQLISALILLMLVYASWKMAMFAREIEETDIVLDVMVWPLQLMLPIGFGLSAIRHFFYALYPELIPVKEAGDE